MKFDRPLASLEHLSGSTLKKEAAREPGARAGVYLTFDTSSSTTVLVKVEFLCVSVANAKRRTLRRKTRSPFSSSDFNKTSRAAADVWNSHETDPDHRRNEGAATDFLFDAVPCPDQPFDRLRRRWGIFRLRQQDPHHKGWRRSIRHVFWVGRLVGMPTAAMIAPKEAGDMAQSVARGLPARRRFPAMGISDAR